MTAAAGGGYEGRVRGFPDCLCPHMYLHHPKAVAAYRRRSLSLYSEGAERMAISIHRRRRASLAAAEGSSPLGGRHHHYRALHHQDGAAGAAAGVPPVYPRKATSACLRSSWLLAIRVCLPPPQY